MGNTHWMFMEEEHRLTPVPSETTVSNRVPNRATSRPLAPIVALLALAALLTGCIYHDGYPAYYGGYGYYGGHGGGHYGYGRRDNWYRGDGSYGGGHHGHGGGHGGHWR
jgi:hypothetical protein